MNPTLDLGNLNIWFICRGFIQTASAFCFFLVIAILKYSCAIGKYWRKNMESAFIRWRNCIRCVGMKFNAEIEQGDWDLQMIEGQWKEDLVDASKTS